MIFKRFYEPKLAQASYLVGCQATREALVVDPNRDIDRYLQAAEDEGLRLTHVTETHIHADFVSGSRELAQRAGAHLFLSGAGGRDWQYQYADDAGATLLSEGSCFRIGRIEVGVMHLPGHTPEHLVFLLTDTEVATEPMGCLTGDFLFVGDVGRPDLLERAAKAKGTMEAEARQLFRSLQRFRKLPDYLQIWPGHGAGSVCGKALGAVPQSTLGYEKRFNWAFQIDEEAEFVRSVLAGQLDPPRYFAEMKQINRTGPRLLGGTRRPARLPINVLETVIGAGGLVVDTRAASEFGSGAIPATINIPANRSFTTWAGSLLPYDTEFHLIVDERRMQTVDELARDLAGIGLDGLAGYFGGDVVEAWRSSRGQLQQIPPLTLAELTARHPRDGKVVLDVRGEGEWASGHIPGSLNIPLGDLDRRLTEVPRGGTLIVHCQTGSRAAIAVSLLLARGLDSVQLFPGGFAEWRTAGQPVETA